MSKKPLKKKYSAHGANRQWAESVARRTGTIVQDMPLPEGKISDIVVSFAEPLDDAFAENDDDRVAILHFACLLWNLAIIRKADRNKYAEAETMAMGVLSGMPYFLAAAQALNLLSAMMKRWEQDFSWCNRIIVDKRIVIENNRMHISIVSAPIPDREDGNTTSAREQLGVGAQARRILEGKR